MFSELRVYMKHHHDTRHIQTLNFVILAIDLGGLMQTKKGSPTKAQPLPHAQ